MTLPNEPHGFAVNVYTREIHKRHAPHALNLRRTTPGGLASILHGQDPVLCKQCFPPPPKAEPAATRQPTSTRFTPKPVTVKPPEAKVEAEADEKETETVGAGKTLHTGSFRKSDGPSD